MHTHQGADEYEMERYKRQSATSDTGDRALQVIDVIERYKCT